MNTDPLTEDIHWIAVLKFKFSSVPLLAPFQFGFCQLSQTLNISSCKHIGGQTPSLLKPGNACPRKY